MRAEGNKVKEKQIRKDNVCIKAEERDVRNKDWRTSREFTVRFRKKWRRKFKKEEEEKGWKVGLR